MADLRGLRAAFDCHGQGRCTRKSLLGIDLMRRFTFDATTIDLCPVALHPWAPFRSTKAAREAAHPVGPAWLHPSFIHHRWQNPRGQCAGRSVDRSRPSPDGQGLSDFSRLHVIHQAQAFFVTRAKSNTQFRRRYSNPGPRRHVGLLRSDWGVTVFYSSKDYPAVLRGS